MALFFAFMYSLKILFTKLFNVLLSLEASICN
nr:MAG TPA: hypothetical protein [Caudoviricetes sp.]